jgi:DNA-binding transcriptional MerR regulator
VAELAELSGTSVRNIRVYQDRGLLPPPRRQGRIGLYGPLHLERLRLIGRLLERGYTFATIRELLHASASGHDLDEVLGLEGTIAAPYTREPPERLTLAELRDRIGAEVDPDLVQRSVALGLLEPGDGEQFVVPSPRLLAAGIDLVRAGIPLSFVLDLAELLREDMTRVAQQVMGGVVSLLLADIDLDDSPQTRRRLADTVAGLRPHAQRTVDAMLTMAMDRESRRLLDQLADRATPGATTTPTPVDRP